MCATVEFSSRRRGRWPASVATVQQYQVDVDPNRLRSYGLPLSAVVRAVMASNSNVGGNVVSQNGSWSIVRGLGLIENLDDIRQYGGRFT